MTSENVVRAIAAWILCYGAWHFFNRFVGTPMSKWIYGWTDEGAEAYFIVLNAIMGVLLLAMVLFSLYES